MIWLLKFFLLCLCCCLVLFLLCWEQELLHLKGIHKHRLFEVSAVCYRPMPAVQRLPTSCQGSLCHQSMSHPPSSCSSSCQRCCCCLLILIVLRPCCCHSYHVCACILKLVCWHWLSSLSLFFFFVFLLFLIFFVLLVFFVLFLVFLLPLTCLCCFCFVSFWFNSFLSVPLPLFSALAWAAAAPPEDDPPSINRSDTLISVGRGKDCFLEDAVDGVSRAAGAVAVAWVWRDLSSVWTPRNWRYAYLKDLRFYKRLRYLRSLLTGYLMVTKGVKIVS